MFIDKVIFNKNSVTVIVWEEWRVSGIPRCNMNKYDSIDCDIGLARTEYSLLRHFSHYLFYMRIYYAGVQIN